MSCGLGTRLMVNKLTMMFSKKVKRKEKNMKEVEREKREEMEGQDTTKGEKENAKLEGEEIGMRGDCGERKEEEERREGEKLERWRR